jgi:hypothetical protein
MRSEEFEEFTTVIADLCAAYDRTPTDARNRSFWDVLKHLHLHDVKRSALKWRNTQRKMPAPIDLKPERSTAPAEKPRDEGPSMSTWAAAANQILMACAYFDERRGFRPIATWESMPERGWSAPLKLAKAVNLAPLTKALAVKADYVRMAEEAEANGEPWDTVEFNRMCRQGFQNLLGTVRA